MKSKKAISLILLFLFWVTSCIQKAEVMESSSGGEESSSSSGESTSCRLSDLGLSTSLGSPETILEAIDLINALPRPLTVACFISALNRPLYISAIYSSLSAQPADGADGPRIFIKSGPLLMSFVFGNNISGNDPDPSYYLEFGQLSTDLENSVKGEVEFPVLKTLSYSSPFERILLENPGTNSKTVCSNCHGNIDRLYTFSNGIQAYETEAVPPDKGYIISLEELNEFYRLCNITSNTTRRCKLFRALFDQSGIFNYTFPDSMYE